MSCRQSPREAPPILIEYRDLVRCTARIDEVFDWQGWEEVGGEDGPEVLFVHHGRLGCYRRARGDGATHLGCAGMPFPFGDFLVTLDTAIREDGGGHRIESELQLYFFALRDDRRRDVWGGRIELAAAPDGSLSGLEVGAMAGVLSSTDLLRRLARAHDCRADSTCWQVALGTTVVDVAVAR